MPNKKKLASAVMAVALLSASSAVYAEDAASAAYQMRMAANDAPVGVTSDMVKAADPDQPRPIKMKLHRHWKKTNKTTAADKAAFDDDVATADTSKTN